MGKAIKTLRGARMIQGERVSEPPRPDPDARAPLPTERIAQALAADPPNVLGLLHHGRLHRLEGVAGDGSARTFVFSGLGVMPYREVLARAQEVVLPTDPEGRPVYTRLKIRFHTTEVNCPACGQRLRAGSAFWAHYNGSHARRPFWVNREHWAKMFTGVYRPPPD